MSRWIDFEDYPSTNTPLSSQNLNDLQDMIKTAIGDVWKIVYPVGSIYISLNSNNPETLFGGRWERLKDTFLLGYGDTYTTAGATGGSASNAHTHEVPVATHTHSLNDNGYAKINLGANDNAFYADMTTNVSFTDNYYKMGSGKRTYAGTDTTTGVVRLGGRTEGVSSGASTATTTSQSDTNNMPPYTVVYMWQRLPDNA